MSEVLFGVILFGGPAALFVAAACFLNSVAQEAKKNK